MEIYLQEFSQILILKYLKNSMKYFFDTACRVMLVASPQITLYCVTRCGLIDFSRRYFLPILRKCLTNRLNYFSIIHFIISAQRQSFSLKETIIYNMCSLIV